MPSLPPPFPRNAPPLPPNRGRADAPAPFASRNQRIRAGIIDHSVDSTVWIGFLALAGWCAIHLQAALDAQSFFLMVCNQFPLAMSIIGLLLIADFLLCIRRGQSLGQLFNGIYRSCDENNQASQNSTRQQRIPLNRQSPLALIKIWLHGLCCRCWGLPLLYVCVLLWLTVNPMIQPIHIQNFSFIDPEGSFTLMVFLLKIISMALLLYGVFLPFGLGFMQNPLPTWYDKLLGVQVMQKQMYKM